MSAARKFRIETTFINELMGMGVYGLTVTRKARADMNLAGVDLCDVAYVLSTGRVVSSDMLEGRGLWDVRGRTVDGIPLVLTIAVISAEYDVELLEILVVQRKGGL
jgi:hypothetical protein